MLRRARTFRLPIPGWLLACLWALAIVLAAAGLLGGKAADLASADRLALASAGSLTALRIRQQLAGHLERHRSQDPRHNATADVVAGALTEDGRPVPPALERGRPGGAEVVYLTRRAGAHRARRQAR